ncbi:MAG: LysR family transcriptional regulator [Bdellovibrionales bacterium]
MEQHADQVLAQIEKIKDDLRSEEALWEGDLRVGVTHKLLENVFVPAWSQFQKSHPNLRLEVYSQRSGQIVEQTQAGELDLGLCFNPLAHPLIKSKVIREQDLLISFRDTHPLTKMTKTQQLAHLSRFPCAAPKAFAGIEICENHPELKKFNIQCKEDFVFDSYEAAIARLQTTDSWCLLPELFVRQHSLAYLRPKGWAAKAKVCAIWNAKKNLSGALREFLHSLEL